MPLVFGFGMAYSPLFYRPRSAWENVARFLTGPVPQPATAAEETPARLDELQGRLNGVLDKLTQRVRDAKLDALVVLVADHGRYFNAANVPLLHIFAGDEVWGVAGIAALSETETRTTLKCDAATGDLLLEEVVGQGFDVAESRGEFRPLGDPVRGAGAPLLEAVVRVGSGTPIVPVHLNCHSQPALPGRRANAFGAALGKALQFSEKRVGILASGGLSGDPHGPLGGWVDDVLDDWVLRRLRTGRSAEVGRIWDVESQNLVGSAAEIRLWTAAGGAMEAVGARAEVIDYIRFHHAAVGAGFAVWETSR